MNILGILGADPDVRNGFNDISAAGPALAGGLPPGSRGWPSGGGRSRRRPRRRRSRPCARAVARPPRRSASPAAIRPDRARAPSTPRRPPARWRRCAGRPWQDAPGARRRARRARRPRWSSPSGSAATIRPSRAVAGPAAVSNRSRTPRRYPPRPRRRVGQRIRDQVQPPPARRSTTSSAPGSPTLTTSVPPSVIPRSQASKASRHRAAVGEDVRDDPTPRRSGPRRPGGRHRSCPRTRRLRPRTPDPLPVERWPAGHRSAIGGRSAPTKADGSAPAARATWTSQPAVVLLPCVPATADERPPGGRVGDDLLPRLSGMAGRPRRDELRRVGVDRGEGLGDRQPVGPRRRS